MSEYWTKDRFVEIGATFIGIYIAIFILYIVLCAIHSDITIDNVMLSAKFALGLDVLAMCVGGLGALIGYTDDGDKKEVVPNDKT